MGRVVSPDGFRRVRMAAVVEAVNHRGWQWRKGVRDNGRPRLLLQSPAGRRYEFRLSEGAWVKKEAAVEAEKGVAA